MKTLLAICASFIIGLAAFTGVHGNDVMPYRCTAGIATIVRADDSERVVMYLRKLGIACSGTAHAEIQSGILYVPAEQAQRAKTILSNLSRTQPELMIQVERRDASADIPCD